MCLPASGSRGLLVQNVVLKQYYNIFKQNRLAFLCHKMLAFTVRYIPFYFWAEQLRQSKENWNLLPAHMSLIRHSFGHVVVRPFVVYITVPHAVTYYVLWTSCMRSTNNSIVIIKRWFRCFIQNLGFWQNYST